MVFQDVKAFLESWGMYPAEEDTTPYNKDVIDNGINEPCFDRMLEQAEEKHGIDFARFCSRVTDATDNAFYIPFLTWKELEEAWNQKV